MRIVDLWDGERYAWAPTGWPDTDFHHDGKRIADGRLMTLEGRPNRSGARSFVGFGLRAHDPETGEVSFELDSQTRETHSSDPSIEENPLVHGTSKMGVHRDANRSRKGSTHAISIEALASNEARINGRQPNRAHAR